MSPASIPRIAATAGLLLLAVAMPASATGFGGAPDYHEANPATLEPGLEADAWKALKSRVGAGKVARDGPLVWAARDLCAAVHEAGDTLSLDPELARQVSLGRGVTEAVVVPFVVSASDPDAALASWTAHVASNVDGFTGRTVGIGALETGGRWLLASLSVERIVKLEPVARALEVEGKIVIQGKKAGSVDDLRVLVAPPAGEVASVPVTFKAGGFKAVAALDQGDGVYTVEILGDVGFGPRVLNLFPITVGTAGTAAVVLSVPWREGRSRNAWMLFDLIVADRKELGLGSLEPDLDLARVAIAHSRDMRDAGFFGHVSPSHGGIEKRTAHLEGVVKVGEVIALASSPQRAFGNLLASPAHASSLHDPAMTHMGVGKVETEDGMLFTVVLAGRQE